jgi:hypothetical protein
MLPGIPCWRCTRAQGNRLCPFKYDEPCAPLASMSPNKWLHKLRPVAMSVAKGGLFATSAMVHVWAANGD